MAGNIHEFDGVARTAMLLTVRRPETRRSEAKDLCGGQQAPPFRGLRESLSSFGHGLWPVGFWVLSVIVEDAFENRLNLARILAVVLTMGTG